MQNTKLYTCINITYIMNIIEIMNSTFVPMVMITGLALIILGLQDRYGRVIDRIRLLQVMVSVNHVNIHLWKLSSP